MGLDIVQHNNDPMQRIEGAAKALATARDEVHSRLATLQADIDAAKRQRLPGLKKAIARMRDAHAELQSLVAAARQLFAKPKTRVLHGLKLGWVKQPGRVTIADEDATIARIRKRLPDRFDEFVAVKYSVRKDAVSALPAEELKRLGIAIEADTESPVVKAVDDDVAKLVKALISDAEIEEQVSG
jgi:phage host-nuclease inhibitor protein Gam